MSYLQDSIQFFLYQNNIKEWGEFEAEPGYPTAPDFDKPEGWKFYLDSKNPIHRKHSVKRAYETFADARQTYLENASHELCVVYELDIIDIKEKILNRLLEQKQYFLTKPWGDYATNRYGEPNHKGARECYYVWRKIERIYYERNNILNFKPCHTYKEDYQAAWDNLKAIIQTEHDIMEITKSKKKAKKEKVWKEGDVCLSGDSRQIAKDLTGRKGWLVVGDTAVCVKRIKEWYATVKGEVTAIQVNEEKKIYHNTWSNQLILTAKSGGLRVTATFVGELDDICHANDNELHCGVI